MGITTLLSTFASTAEESQGIAALGLDPIAILAQAITFLVLFFIIKKFALDGIVKTLEDRRKTIDQGVELGYEMEREKTKLDEQVAAALQETRAEADKIIAAAHEESGQIIREAESTASRKTDQMISDAQNKLAQDIANAKQEVAKEMRVMVADLTAKVIGEKLDAKKDAALLDKALKEMK
jgi:F-type H+-transporting ATPase subunit b